MKTSMLKTFSLCSVLLICLASFGYAATECTIVPSSIPWDGGDQGTWVSDTYQLSIQCTDNGSPVEGYQAQFDISLMEGTNQAYERELAKLTAYSTPTNSSGIAQIVVPLIHVEKNDGKYVHICPFDDISCNGGVASSSSSSQPSLAGIASLTAASTTGCTNTNVLPGCCETTITVTCCTPNQVFSYCTTVPVGQCPVGTTNPDPCTTIFTQYAPGGICSYCTGKCDISSAITLASFTAKPGKKSVIINWTTETETNNAGFNIYRANAEDGDYVKVNIDIIPADAGGVNGASYQFIDTAVKNRFKKCFYKLGDVDNSGAEVMHGPISVSRRPK